MLFRLQQPHLLLIPTTTLPFVCLLIWMTGGKNRSAWAFIGEPAPSESGTVPTSRTERHSRNVPQTKLCVCACVRVIHINGEKVAALYTDLHEWGRGCGCNGLSGWRAERWSWQWFVRLKGEINWIDFVPLIHNKEYIQKRANEVWHKMHSRFTLHQNQCDHTPLQPRSVLRHSSHHFYPTKTSLLWTCLSSFSRRLFMTEQNNKHTRLK